MFEIITINLYGFLYAIHAENTLKFCFNTNFCLLGDFLWVQLTKAVSSIDEVQKKKTIWLTPVF